MGSKLQIENYGMSTTTDGFIRIMKHPDLFMNDETAAPMTLQEKVNQALEIMDRAIHQYQPTHVIALFSGGHDSRVVTEVAAMHPSFSKVVHIDTTIGIEETHDYVIETVNSKGWDCQEYTPPVSYEQICIENGMPGPGSHRFCYIRLKERCLEQVLRDHKKKISDKIMFITGVRLSESKRRMGNVQEIQKEKAKIWTAPILHFTDEDKNEFMQEHSIKRNPVVDTINMSGECLCGSFAENGELDLVAEFFPKTAEKIFRIQDLCRDKGVHAKWGTRPPCKNTTGMALCFSCIEKAAA
jgi:3'-phosphoadenosine 5'-phosphosulfate sulfotransferase (PAPS reductase)/FAD synthetase